MVRSNCIQAGKQVITGTRRSQLLYVASPSWNGKNMYRVLSCDETGLQVFALKINRKEIGHSLLCDYLSLGNYKCEA